MQFVFVHAPDPPPLDPFPYIQGGFEASGLGEMHYRPYRRDEINDDAFLEALRHINPAAIFYGADIVGERAPTNSMYHAMRSIAPLISILPDGGDPNWAGVCREIRDDGRFDLVVSIDGVHSDAVDHVTLTPVDARLYSDPPQHRKIRCGFSGSWLTPMDPAKIPRGDIRRQHPRAETWAALEEYKGAVVQKHSLERSVRSYAQFMMQCKIAIGMSWAQVPKVICDKRGRPKQILWDSNHQLKGRVLDAAWAGCCLLESAGSPVSEWFLEGSFFRYSSPEEMLYLLRVLSDAEIETAAQKLNAQVKAHYHPRSIYGEMLSKVGVQYG